MLAVEKESVRERERAREQERARGGEGESMRERAREIASNRFDQI